MSRFSRHNHDAQISHDWTCGTPDRRERVIIATPYPHNMGDVCHAAIATCIRARQLGGWPVHHVTKRAQTFGIAT